MAAGTTTAQKPRVTPAEIVDEGSEVTNGIAAIPLERLAGTAINIRKQNGHVETVYVGKLNIDQTVALAHIIREAMTTLQSAPKPKETGNLYAQFLDLLLPLLDPDEMSKLFSVLIDRPIRWVRREVGLPDMAAILEAVAENNDFAVIARPFQRLGLGGIQGQANSPDGSTAPTEPSPSSEQPVTASETSGATRSTG